MQRRIRVCAFALSFALLTSIGIGPPAIASDNASARLAVSSKGAQPLSLKKDCAELLKQGYARKCLNYQVTYGARCSKKERLYVGKCWVGVYGAFTLCTCAGPFRGRYYWSAPE